MKKTLSFLAAIGVSAAGFLSLAHAPVFADGPYTINVVAADGHTLAEQDGQHLKIDGQFADLKDAGDNTIGVVACDSETACTITVADGTPGSLSYNSDAFIVKRDGNVYNHEFISGPTTLRVEDSQAPDPGFSGKVWFFWDCDAGFCSNLLTDINTTREVEDPETHELTIEYDPNYVKATDVVDTTSGKTPNISALNASGHFYFTWEASGTDVLSTHDFATWTEFQEWFDNEFHVGPDQSEEDYWRMKEFAIDPTGASSGANIISTNGDRVFRLTIYNSGSYYGVSNASQPDDLTYYPEFWDKGFFNPAYDVSGTSLDSPAVIQAYLLEPKITLTSDPVSAPITRIEVASPNVPARAVTITKRDNAYDIVFNSNYYEKVIFKVTSGVKTYYVAIARTVIVHDYERNPALFVPETDTREYDVLATYSWADGTEKTFALEEIGIGQGGKGLQVRVYALSEKDQGQVNFNPAGNPPASVSYTTAEKGSSITSYKGTLGGSGKGTRFKIDRGSFILDITK